MLQDGKIQNQYLKNNVFLYANKQLEDKNFKCIIQYH